MTEQANPDTTKELEAIVLGILDGLATVLSPQVMQIITDRAAQHMQPTSSDE